MCDFGITALVTSIVATVVSTTMGVVSSVQQGKAAQEQANYQAELNRRNARIAQQNADDKRQEGIEETRMQRLKTLQKVGAQQAALAANGVDVSEGTALDLIEDTAAMGELDALTTQYNYEKQALAFESQADNFNNQANLDVIAGQNAYRAGVTNAWASGISGLGDTAAVASKWYSPKSSTNNGVPTEYTGTKKASARQMKNNGYLGDLPLGI